MMRNMSFFLTTAQIRAQTKTVTRRLGWSNLKSGERFRAVVKAMGLKPGEKMQVLCDLECVSNTAERLSDIEKRDERIAVKFSFMDVQEAPGVMVRNSECIAEGFPERSGSQFVRMFCEHMQVVDSTIVNRIEFKYV